MGKKFNSHFGTDYTAKVPDLESHGLSDCIVIFLEKNAWYKNTDFYLVENYRNSRWVMKILEAQLTDQSKPTVLCDSLK